MELHVCGISNLSLWHTIRRAAGTWFQFGDVKRVVLAQNPGSPDPGIISGDVSCAKVGLELHVCVSNGNGQLWHTIRRADAIGSWFPFDDVGGDFGLPGRFVRVGAAELNPLLHVCGVTDDGRLWHAARVRDSWSRFENVKNMVLADNPGSPDPGNFSDVDCAGRAGELHVCAVTEDGNLWHTIRRTNGTWFPFGNVKDQAGHNVGLTGRPALFRSVGTSGIGHQLNVSATTRAGDLLHTVRRPLDGSWLPWSVETGTGFQDVGCAGIGNDFHVCVVMSDGRLLHSMATPFGNMEGQAGERGDFQFVSAD